MRRREPTIHVAIHILVLSLLSPCLYPAVPSTAMTSDRPSWTEQAMFRFGDEVFFVGQASCASTPEEGRQRAFVQGTQEILNYVQAQSLDGVRVTTQKVFEDSADPRCPSPATTVWRLLRVDLSELTRLASRARGQRIAATRDRSADIALRLSPGLTRRDVLALLGRPVSIEIGQDGTSVLDYQSVIVSFGRDSRLTTWRLTRGTEIESDAHQARHTDRSDLPAVVLNDRSELPPLNIVYTGDRFRETIVITRWNGEWPVCALVDRGEIMAWLAERIREMLPSAEPTSVRPWITSVEALHPQPRTSGLWTCNEAKLFTPNPHDCLPW